jgi:hypothetical protein
MMKSKLIVLLGVIGLIIFLFFYFKSDINLSQKNKNKFFNNENFKMETLFFIFQSQNKVKPSN